MNNGHTIVLLAGEFLIGFALGWTSRRHQIHRDRIRRDLAASYSETERLRERLLEATAKADVFELHPGEHIRQSVNDGAA